MTDRLSAAERSALMAKVGSKDTKPELLVRRVAHGLGYRFRLHRADLPGRPDLVLPRHRLAIFVHGCFWHRHPGCRRASTPATNGERWKEKFERNKQRDARAIRKLRALGWHVLVIWECETRSTELVASRLTAKLEGAVAARRSALDKEPRLIDKSKQGGYASVNGSRGKNGAVARPRQVEIMLNCADLFAGAGGFTLAAQEADLRVRLAVENDKHAIGTYRDNFCKGQLAPKLLTDDITEIDACKAFREAFPDGDQCDLLLGGPPCQGFSTHRIKDAGVDDHRNDLIHTYFDFVRAFSPSAFLMENVPGMLWDRHAAALDRFYLEGALAGYDVRDAIVVDARNYGIGQRRKRVFILGIRSGLDASDLTWPPPPTHGGETARRANPDLLPWVNCASAFADAPPDDENDVHMSHSEELVNAFRKTPANGGSRKDSGRVLPCHRTHDGHKDVYGRIDPQQPAPTMTTACINPSKGRFVHPVEPHGITVRQAARIQTFPDDFVFGGGLMAAGKQVGNAVPVELGRQLIQHLVPLLRRGRIVEEREAPTLGVDARGELEDA